ncbi:tigger transposable element-derived protein 6-like [Rhipicephalus sanguineus]|uniref:tigger transposable element-derived protein 6-like n=1 Tax=Rhipicephalus sanguineus TaxID=34632 RepID=UPI0018941BDC|nr:tigger transposable element-derived protein 6-like [Rhipicephalus sanguineus]
MTGSEKLPIFVIGKSTSPRCFKGKRQLPVKYTANRKAWMTREIFAKWLCEWDEKLAKANRKVCLVLDNCTAHHTAAALKNIELLFLPANCTAKIQPLDQGVIMSLKAGYRKRLIDRLLLNMRMKRDTDVDLYAALEMLQAAWMNVTATTIANCFRHASFAAAPDASDEPLLDEPATPDGFATSDEVAASWTALRDAGVVPDSESFCDYVSADSEVVATEQLLDDDIVRAVNDPDETSDDDSADERARSDSVPKASNVPTASEALDAVDVLRRYYGAHEGGEDGMNIAAAAERAIVRIRKMQQRPITDFFAATAV